MRMLLTSCAVVLVALLVSLAPRPATAQTVAVFFDSSTSMNGKIGSGSSITKLHRAREILSGIRQRVLWPMWVVPWNGDAEESFALFQNNQEQVELSLASLIPAGGGSTRLHKALSGLTVERPCIVYLIVTDDSPDFKTAAEEQIMRLLNGTPAGVPVGVFGVESSRYQIFYDFYSEVAQLDYYQVEKLSVASGVRFINRVMERFDKSDCPLM